MQRDVTFSSRNHFKAGTYLGECKKYYENALRNTRA